MVTTIPAGTLRLLLTSIGYRAKARKEMRRQPSMVPRRPCRLTAPPGGGCALTADPVTDRKPPGWHGLRYAAPLGMDP
mgnify:CR=1 FL=1